MGMYSENVSRDEDFGVDMDAIVEAFLIDDLTHNYGEDAIKEFCAPGGVADALYEAKIFSNKRTIHRLSKQDDYSRRVVISAISMAASKHDPLYFKLIKSKIALKNARQKIVDKYGSQASRIATKGQKAYIKAMKGVNINLNTSNITDDPNR